MHYFSYWLHLSVFRCQTLQQNLTFIDCLLPYPGLSCHFKCNTGYEPTVNSTVCGSEGQWMPPTDTLCKGITQLVKQFKDNVQPSCNIWRNVNFSGIGLPRPKLFQTAFKGWNMNKYVVLYVVLNVSYAYKKHNNAFCSACVNHPLISNVHLLQCNNYHIICCVLSIRD